MNMTLKRTLAGLIAAGGFLATPALHAASDDTPSIVSYGFDGFWTGAQIGLATGYLATGSNYERREWRTVVFGAGIGALVGVGAGITLGIVDVGQAPPRTGYLVLRDVGYGVGLGAIVGTAVGALFLIDSGSAKDLLVGASWGTVIGGAAGVAFGLIESAAADRAPAAVVTTGLDSLRITVVGAEGSWLPMPALSGRF
jgi:hypothetical protein